MTLIEQIKADRDAGTDGPWEFDPPSGHTFQGGFWAGDAPVCEFGDSEMYNEGCGEPPIEADARRIARVPAMEAALLAADELAAAVHHEREVVCQDFDMQLAAIRAVDTALDAYRAAVSGGDT